jgi:RimJ/RimL family protein N-acetyltransferase
MPDELLIRELTRGDRRAVAFSFRRLGDRSRSNRFLGNTRELSARELDRLTEVDHWHHEALIAFSPVPRSPIGVVEYVRLEAFDEAEIAIAVVDDWQGRGVGRELMNGLRIRARAAGVRWFMATTRRGNHAALALAGELGGFRVVGRYRDTIELRIEVSESSPSHSATAPATPARSLVRL